MLSSCSAIVVYLERSGSNTEEQRDEEKDDESEGGVLHVVLFCHLPMVPCDVQLNHINHVVFI